MIKRRDLLEEEGSNEKSKKWIQQVEIYSIKHKYMLSALYKCLENQNQPDCRSKT